MTIPDPPGHRPSDATSLTLEYSNRSAPPPLWARLLLRPIGWPLLLSFTILFSIYFYNRSMPHADHIAYADNHAYQVIAIVDLLLTFAYLIRIILFAVLRRIYSDSAGPARNARWLAPLLASLCILYSPNLPLHAMFRLSQFSISQLARDAAASPTELPDRRVGRYIATDIRSLPGGVFSFRVRNTENSDRYGFIYLPPGSPPPPRYYRLERFTGNWYIFYMD